MSSGELPLEIYHRTNAIGSGSYGSVVVVYDDEGQEYAMKLFEDDEEDDEDTVNGSNYGIDLGALREISILRLLKEENSHPNIIEIHDVQTSFGEEDDEEVGIYAMAMPLYPDGSLADAFSKITTKKQKAVIAHGIVKAVAYLHENSIIHRDIKSDNVLLKFDASRGIFEPVVIDFSLAKFISSNDSPEFEPTHTASVGTPTYRAPEVVDEKPYGLPSDLWSVGVVLLEMLQGKCFESFKDKGAIKEISQCLDNLPEGQPFPTLLRGLLEMDPAKRWTAREALNCDLFAKFNLSEASDSKSFHLISLSDALPIEGGESGDECNIGKENRQNFRESKDASLQKKKANSVISKRSKFVHKVCDWMEWENPLTAKAAMVYSTQMNEITGNVDDLNASNTMLDCLVLAHKFFEFNLCGTSDLDGLYEKFGQGGFDADEYLGNENTIFSMMDFCLYPR